MSILFEALYPSWSLEDDFFGYYNYLDDVVPPNDIVILNYQLSIIKGALEGEEKNGKKWFLVEDLIRTKDAMQFESDQIINNAIQNIFNNIDALRQAGRKENINQAGRKNLDNFKILLDSLKNSINSLINSKNGMFTIEQLNEVQRLLQACDDFDKASNLGSWYKKNGQFYGKRGIARQIVGMLNGLQGALLEEEGTAWFSERIPEIMTINTAKVEIEKQGQLISDLLMFRLTNVDLNKGVKIKYRIGKKGGAGTIEKEVGLLDFLNLVDSYTGQQHIIITDRTHEQLFQNSVAGIQAKSGINQMPFNANKKNSFSIKELDDSFYKRVLQDLNVLYYWGRRYQIESRDIHEDYYNAMFNYAVSTKIPPTIMQFDKNQFLLTRKGLISYYEYFYEEMLAKKRFFKAAKPVSIAYLDVKNALTF